MVEAVLLLISSFLLGIGSLVLRPATMKLASALD
jgi:hypothetical protein